MKYKLLNPSTTVDTVPVDFKLDNFMLRGAMKEFSSFVADFHETFEATKKVMQKPMWRRVDQIFLQHCMPSC